MQEVFAITKVQSADLPELLALYRHLIPDDPALDIFDAERIFSRFQAMGDNAIYLGRVGKQVTCSCTLVVVPNLTRGGSPYGLIENVITHSAHRGQGLGKKILTYAVKAAWQLDCYKVMLLTGSKKSATLAFYQSCGFEASKTGFQIRRIAKRPDEATLG